MLIAAALVFCVAPGKIPPEAKKAALPFIGLNCAHRGLHTEDQSVPENSLAAFEAAREGGYGVELDVQLSKDGFVVVFHDDDLVRACGIDKKVNTLDYEELSELRLFGTNERIPLFTEVLKVLGDAPVIVELKTAGANNAEHCQKTLDILRENGRFWCIESFDPRIGAWFRKNAPDVLRGQLSSAAHNFDTVSKLQAFLLSSLLLNFLSRPHFVAYSTDPRPFTELLCRLFGAMTVVWTLHPDHDIAMFEQKNDAVIFEYYTPKPRYR